MIKILSNITDIFKTGNWFSCDCEDSRRETTIYRAPKDDEDWENRFGPCFEFCLEKPDGNGPWMLRHCALFPFKYTRLLDVIYKAPSLRLYVEELIYRMRHSKVQTKSQIRSDLVTN